MRNVTCLLRELCAFLMLFCEIYNISHELEYK